MPKPLTSPPKPLQASRWLQLPVLLDAEEMAHLCQALLPFQIYLTGSVYQTGETSVTPTQFQESYRSYIEELQKGHIADDPTIKQHFCSLWTRDDNALYSMPIGQGKEIVKAQTPVIHLRPHQFNYSTADGKFRSMVLGQDSISWGVQFSYPYIYQDPITNQIVQVMDPKIFINTALFKELRHWMRHHTLPTKFNVGGVTTVTSIRLGKKCFEWIHNHPQMKALNIRVAPT